MSVRHILSLVCILTVYLSVILLVKPHVFTFTYPSALTETYLRSQDIFDYTGSRRVILSDSEIHLAAGYLYTTGGDPSYYNFQHPPLIKYFFGIATRLFNRPLLVQLFFGITLLLLTYQLAWLYSKKISVPLIACLLLAIDPLMIDLTSQALLDLGLAVFVLAYVITFLYTPRSTILSGMWLGCIALSKFWTVAAFFFCFSFAYQKYIAKTFELRGQLISLITAAGFFALGYLPAFVIHHGQFNLFIFQMKTLNYWLHHSTANIPGNTFIMFVSGHFSNWWSHPRFTSIRPWSPLWPLAGLATIYHAYSSFTAVNPSRMHLVSFLPLAYLLYLNLQAPFPRYFITLLPFIYLCLAFKLSQIPARINVLHSKK